MEPTPQRLTHEQLLAEGATPILTEEDLRAEGATPSEQAEQPEKPLPPGRLETLGRSAGQVAAMGLLNVPLALAQVGGRPRFRMPGETTPNRAPELESSKEEKDALERQGMESEPQPQEFPEEVGRAYEQQAGREGEAAREHPYVYWGTQLAPIVASFGLPAVKRALGGLLESRGIQSGRRFLTGGADPIGPVKKALSEGAVREAKAQGAIAPGKTIQTGSETLDAAREAAGQGYAQLVARLEGAGVEGPSRDGLIQGLESYAGELANKGADNNVLGVYRNAIQRLRRMPTQNGKLGLKQTEDFKRYLQEVPKYERVGPTPSLDAARRDVAFRMKDAVEDAVQRGAASNPTPEIQELAAQFEPVKERLGNIIEASDAATRGAAQAARRQGMPLTSKMVGVAAGAAAPTGPLGKIAAGKGAAETMSLLQRYLPGTKAWAQLSLAEKLLKNPQFAGTPLGQALRRLQLQSPAALEALHARLWQSPEYRLAARAQANQEQKAE